MRLTDHIVLRGLSLSVAAYAIAACGFLPSGFSIHPDVTGGV
jgi:hypothetical protein